MREPSLPIYVGLLLHGGTRKRSLVDKFYDLELSVSYVTQHAKTRLFSKIKFFLKNPPSDSALCSVHFKTNCIKNRTSISEDTAPQNKKVQPNFLA